jgi:signal transduction histidine kinase/ligand-binding sensor domain-containing protein
MRPADLPLLPALLLLLVPGLLRAQPLDLSIRPEQVLQNEASGYVIRAVLRDGAGFVWAGTQQGLDRYDGARVRHFRPDEVGHRMVLALEDDPINPTSFWVGTEGGGLRRYDPTREAFAEISAPGGLTPTDTIPAILAQGGVVWAAVGSRGVWRGEASGTGALLGLPAPLGQPLALAEADGLVWVGGRGGVAGFDSETGRLHAPASLDALGEHDVTALAAMGRALWIGTRTGLLFRYDLDGDTLEPPSDAESEISSLQRSRARPGVLWVGTRTRGLLTLDPATGLAQQRSGAASASNDVLHVHEDGQALLWIGTTLGLYRADVRPPPFRSDGAGPLPTHLPGRMVLGLYEAPSSPDTLWVGQAQAGAFRYDRASGRLSPFPPDGTGPDLAFSFAEDAAGRLWVGGGDGAVHLLDRAAGSAEAVPIDPARAAHVLQVYEAPSYPGRLWLATRPTGLLLFDPQARRVVRRFEGLPTEIWRVHERPTDPGALWLGTHQDGLIRLDPATGATRSWRAADGCLPGDGVVSLASTGDGALWAGTESSGFVRLDAAGTCRAYTEADGFPADDAGSLVPLPDGRIWIGTSDGLVRFDPATGAFVSFATEDGLPADIFHYNSFYQSASGALFFGGAAGVVGFDPSEIAVPDEPPPVRITALFVDGEPFPLTRNADGTLAPVSLRSDQRDVAVEFAALDLHRPERNRYRAWLEGAEDDWRALGTRAETRYPALPYGAYRLRVAGAGRSGVFGEAEPLAFTIRTPLWLRPWFWALSFVLTAAAFYATYRWRLAQILRVERARQRIADDLHDDIGSRMSAVALRLDLVGRAPGMGEAERERLSALAQSARGVVDELRDTVWMVDAGHDDLASLVSRMEGFAAEMLRGRPYAFHRPDDLSGHPLGMEQRRHLYLWYKEALHNVVRHAGPCRVDVTVSVDRGRLQLTVQDEGAGFEAAALNGQVKRRGRGLQTLSARADALGGTLALESRPGAGTTAALSVRLA